VEECYKAGTVVAPSQPMRLQMNPTLKDKAWKLSEIALPIIALIWVVAIDWKSFVAWLFDSVSIVLEAVIPIVLLAILFFALERND
jgi:hypothetical protein